MTDKVFNLFIAIVYIVAIGVVIYGFVAISTTDTVKLDDYTRESLLDEYNARGSYTGYERVDVSDRFME